LIPPYANATASVAPNGIVINGISKLQLSLEALATSYAVSTSI
jgi:hypothetical protein